MQNVVVDEEGIEVDDYENNDEGLFENMDDGNGISPECSLAGSDSVESSSSDDSGDARDSDGFSRSPYTDDVKPGYRYFRKFIYVKMLC